MNGSAEECPAAGGAVGGARNHSATPSPIAPRQFCSNLLPAQAAAALVGAYQVWEKSAAPAHPPAAPAESFSAD
eukprot:COSAG04_NODE_16598_length_494_cov_0.908861_1_plen_73_part_10